MKKLILLILLAAITLSATAAKGPKDFPITVTVRCNRLRPHRGAEYQQVGVSIDGKPYEFIGEAEVGMLGPGNYQARLLPPDKWHKPDGFNLNLAYEILLPSGKTWIVQLSGIGYDPCGTNT